VCQSKPKKEHSGWVAHSYGQLRYNCVPGKSFLSHCHCESNQRFSVSAWPCGYPVRLGYWIIPTTTSFPRREDETFQIIHPFHPLFGKIFMLVTCQRNWKEKRVYYQNEAGTLCSMPLEWNSRSHRPFCADFCRKSGFSGDRFAGVIPLVGVADTYTGGVAMSAAWLKCKAYYLFSALYRNDCAIRSRIVKSAKNWTLPTE
jgi:hypothetical protein